MNSLHRPSGAQAAKHAKKFPSISSLFIGKSQSIPPQITRKPASLPPQPPDPTTKTDFRKRTCKGISERNSRFFRPIESRVLPGEEAQTLIFRRVWAMDRIPCATFRISPAQGKIRCPYPLGPKTMSKTPETITIAPAQSQRSGRNPSRANAQRIERITKTPP